MIIDVYYAEFCVEAEHFDRSYGSVEELLEEICLDGGVEEDLREAIEQRRHCELTAYFEGDPPIIIRFPGQEER